jgi:glycosyltransferase involved in cell wall biosynthesis
MQKKSDTNNTLPISAVCITLNEERWIKQYIESLWFAEEIIIVDSFSTDNTVKIASQFDKVTVLQRKFDNFSSQKNYALSKAKNNWVTFFDLDEEIKPELAQELITAFKTNKSAVAFSVKRNLIFMNKPIKYSGFQTDWVIRFFNKETCSYTNLVHEKLACRGPIKKLKNTVPHHSYKSFDDYTSKLYSYSSLQAQTLFQKGKKATFFHFIFRPAYRFWHQYLIRLGILDGKEGFILAYINAYAVFRRYTKLYLLHKKIE